MQNCLRTACYSQTETWLGAATMQLKQNGFSSYFFFVADSLEMLLRVGCGLLVSDKLTHTDLAVKVRVTKIHGQKLWHRGAEPPVAL